MSDRDKCLGIALLMELLEVRNSGGLQTWGEQGEGKERLWKKNNNGKFVFDSNKSGWIMGNIF